jgi:hypothetical protein
MDASRSSGLDCDQHQQREDPEWHAAVQLVGLCVPVADSDPDAAAAIQLVALSVPVVADSSPNSAAAAAAPDVSTGITLSLSLSLSASGNHPYARHTDGPFPRGENNGEKADRGARLFSLSTVECCGL